MNVKSIRHARFEIHRVVVTKFQIFWHATLCPLVKVADVAEERSAFVLMFELLDPEEESSTRLGNFLNCFPGVAT
jgi:hypothetical protein